MGEKRKVGVESVVSIEMDSVWVSLFLSAVAFVVTMLAYPHVLSYARRHNIVDNPNARKLQRVPVPVMGGLTVYIGYFVASTVAFLLTKDVRIVKVMAVLTVMGSVGIWDDIKDITPALRFAVEVLVVWAIMILFDVEINDFHGLWGIRRIPAQFSIPLSLIAGVGIINAVNLIDGVDGLCSSFGMMTCLVFAYIFHHVGDTTMFFIAMIVIGGLLPFFFHNVFGQSSKMFLGDGGSLMLGTLLTLFTFNTLSADSPCFAIGYSGLSLVALTLAILSIPVFDTLKVMIYRVARGKSPFLPDKTHLHHLFIELGFSHLATSFIMVFMNLTIVGLLLLAWSLGLSMDGQVYWVIFLAVMFTWGLYFTMEGQHRQNDGEGSVFFQKVSKRGKATNISMTPFWQFFRRIVDSRFLGGKHVETGEAEGVDETETPARPDPRIQ